MCYVDYVEVLCVECDTKSASELRRYNFMHTHSLT
jgi:hypothetical protein